MRGPRSGRLVVIGEEPLLVAFPSMNGQGDMILSGNPGTVYEILVQTEFNPSAPWSSFWQGTFKELLQDLPATPGTQPGLFPRAVRP